MQTPAGCFKLPFEIPQGRSPDWGARKFRAQILSLPEWDGSFVDSHELGKSYGTAMALLVLGRTR